MIEPNNRGEAPTPHPALPWPGIITLPNRPEWTVTTTYDGTGGTVDVSSPDGGFSCRVADLPYILLCDNFAKAELREALDEAEADRDRYRAALDYIATHDPDESAAYTREALAGEAPPIDVRRRLALLSEAFGMVVVLAEKHVRELERRACYDDGHAAESLRRARKVLAEARAKVGEAQATGG